MYKLLAAVFAATLLSSTALAEVTLVAKPGEKTITLVCSKDVLPGTVVLSNPPKVNCKDFGLAKTLIGTGVTIGPDVNVDRIARAVRRATRENRNTRVTPLPVKTARGFLSAEERLEKDFEGLGLSEFCKDYIREHMHSMDVHGDMVEECTNLEKGLTRWGDKIVKRKKPRFTQEDYQPRNFDRHTGKSVSKQPRRAVGVWQPIDGVNDDPNPEFTKKFPGITRNREFFISGTSSCRGWVPVQDIVNGKCRDGKVKVD